MKRKHKVAPRSKHRESLHRAMSIVPPPPPPLAATTLPEISVFAYTEEDYEENETASIEELARYRNHAGTVWINVNGLDSPAAVERICNTFQIHHLVIEDILNPSQRPKCEDFETYASIVMKMFYLAEDAAVITEQVSLILGHNYVLSFQERTDQDVFEPLRVAIRSKKGKLRKLKADYLAYSLVDAVVDNYFVILETFSEKVELLEDEVLETPSKNTLQALHDLRNQLIILRKSVWPLREVTDHLMRNADELVTANTTAYLRDVYDHTVQIMEQIEVLRDIIAGMLEMYLSSLSYNLNGVLKRLTIITTIFMPLSVLAGIGGMSEWSMMTGPENWRLSYPAFLLGLGVLGVATYGFFKWRKWA